MIFSILLLLVVLAAITDALLYSGNIINYASRHGWINYFTGSGFYIFYHLYIKGDEE